MNLILKPKGKILFQMLIDEGSPEADIMDITEEWLDTENIDSINLNVQAPNISILKVI